MKRCNASAGLQSQVPRATVYALEGLNWEQLHAGVSSSFSLTGYTISPRRPRRFDEGLLGNRPPHLALLQGLD